MYGKIFASMYDGSLYGNWQAIVTFQQMIVLCGPDGVVDMTAQALAARTSIPLDVIETGIEALEAPDRYSRTPEQEGRRIERLDAHRPWGWRIVNYAKYRRLISAEEKREADRVRIAEKRRQARQGATERDSRDMSQASQSVADVAQAEVEVEVRQRSSVAPKPTVRADPLFARFWACYPRKVAKQDAYRAFVKVGVDEQILNRMLGAIERHRGSEQWRRDGGQFVPYPATWLNRRQWEDEDMSPDASSNGTHVLPRLNPATGLPNWV